MLTVIRNALYEKHTDLKMPWLVLRDGIAISDFLTKTAAQGTVNSMKNATTFPWRKSEYTINEICDIHFKETKIKITNQTLRWRMGRSKNDVDQALSYKTQRVLRKPASKKCPDGVMRTDKEIAKMIGLSYSGWVSIKNRVGLVKAFTMKRRKDSKKPKSNKKPGVVQTHLCPDGVERTHRQIAKFLGINLTTWRGRYRKFYNVKKAWYYDPKTTRPVGEAKVVKTTEEIRQQKALDALPSASPFEAQFW